MSDVGFRRCTITLHAIERYRERIERGIPIEHAIAALRHQMSRARYVKNMNHNGYELWRGPKPRRLRFLISRFGEDVELVTVLRAFDRQR